MANSMNFIVSLVITYLVSSTHSQPTITQQHLQTPIQNAAHSVLTVLQSQPSASAVYAKGAALKTTGIPSASPPPQAGPSTVTVGSGIHSVTMTANGMKVHDTVQKTIEPHPDVHKYTQNDYKRSAVVDEQLKTPNDGRSNTFIVSSKELDSSESQVTTQHGDLGTQTRTSAEKDVALFELAHKNLRDKNRFVKNDVITNCYGCNRRLKNEIRRKNSRLSNSQNSMDIMRGHYDRLISTYKDANRIASNQNDVHGYQHKTQQTTGTVHTVKIHPNNVMVGTEHNVDTQILTHNLIDRDSKTQQNASFGQLISTGKMEQSGTSGQNIVEHNVNALHDSPLHHFAMNNKQTERENFRQMSMNANYNTELKRKDGTNTKTHVENVMNLDSSHEEHLDHMSIRSFAKAHPEHPTIVNLDTKIVDHDHLKLEQTNKKNQNTVFANGGRREMHITEEKHKSTSLETTPVDHPLYKILGRPSLQPIKPVLIKADLPALVVKTPHDGETFHPYRPMK